MPTSTAISGIGLSNLGPLTTTFTPPPSCVQSSGRTMFAKPTDPLPVGYVDCIWNMENCFPSPSQLPTETAPPYTEEVAYFSPGIACPSGWTTAGTAALPLGGGPYFSPEVSGGFELPEYYGLFFHDHPEDHFILANAITYGETAVQCCPKLVRESSHLMIRLSSTATPS
jgi:hypothetical protein